MMVILGMSLKIIRLDLELMLLCLLFRHQVLEGSF
jgi:hypothetical protein